MLTLAIILAAAAVGCYGQDTNTYYLYTENTINNPETINTAATVLPSSYNTNVNTIILVHGHGGSASSSLNPLVKEAILKFQNPTLNVIVVDWQREASFSYSASVASVPLVAKNLASFITWLVELEVTTGNTQTQTYNRTNTTTSQTTTSTTTSPTTTSTTTSPTTTSTTTSPTTTSTTTSPTTTSTTTSPTTTSTTTTSITSPTTTSTTTSPTTTSTSSPTTTSTTTSPTTTSTTTSPTTTSSTSPTTTSTTSPTTTSTTTSPTTTSTTTSPTTTSSTSPTTTSTISSTLTSTTTSSTTTSTTTSPTSTSTISPTTTSTTTSPTTTSTTTNPTTTSTISPTTTSTTTSPTTTSTTTSPTTTSTTTSPTTTVTTPATTSSTTPAPTPAVKVDQLHLVGFGLGAHVVGIASRQLSETTGRVGRITGLDPSGSQWGSNSDRLRRGDALYVEVLHTDGSGPLANGIGTGLGDIDFYANGGGNQPGCFSHSCSHNRAFELFAASMFNTNLVGYPCASTAQLNHNRCRGNPLPMGGTRLSKSGSRVYRINTKRNYPF